MVDFWYLGNVVLNENFLFALLALTAVLWTVMSRWLGNNSFWGALGLSFLAIIFLPVMLQATGTGSLFFLLLILGGIALSEIFKWSLSSSLMIAAFALFSAYMILPKF